MEIIGEWIMKRNFLILLCLILFIVSIAAVSATEDVNQTDNLELSMNSNSEDKVDLDNNNGLDENNDLNKKLESDSNILAMSKADKMTGKTIDVEDFTFGDIQKAVDSADEGDTVYLKAGTYLNNGNGRISISHNNISIVGVKDSTILDAQKTSGIFNIYTKNGITIKDIVFINSKANGSGGALYMKSGTVTNCNFTNNTADYSGAINMDSSTVTNCNFSNNSAYRGGAVYFYSNGEVTNCNFVNNTASELGGAIRFSGTGTVTNCNFANNEAYYGGAINIGSGTVTNCNFTNNTATSQGGAIRFSSTGTVSNCNFTDNTATYYGGAVYFNSNGEVTNCNFINNTATGEDSWGGAIYIYSGTVSNCNFVNNTASGDGGAVYFSSTGEVTNCNFADNSASRGGAIFSNQRYTTADTCIFKRNSGDNVNTVIYPPTLNVDNFTTYYGSNEKLEFDLKTNSSIPVTNGNILISVYFKDNGEWVRNYTCLSGEGWIPDLPVGSYIAVFNTEYAEFQKINRTITITLPNVRYSINVTSLATNNKTVNITAKSDIPKDILWDGKLLFILPNDTQINATYGANGTWWAEHTFDAYGEYKVNATYVGLDNVTVNNATITVNKIKTELSGNAITTTYNINKDLIITLKDNNGNPVSGAKLIVDLNGAKTYSTDSNGQVKVSTKGLTPKIYTAKVTFNGDTNYAKSAKDIKVTVKKAASKIAAKAKTFKTITKTKKYAIVLKNNVNKAISKATVYLKVGGKTYKATTNSKGKATFKITKLSKKGTYKAAITFKGNAYYNKATKKVTIKVKQVWKTVSKGSKDKAAVNKIQKALKKNGYYRSYPVNGIYQQSTFNAVKQFQKAKGLKVTGKVDEKTAVKLKLI